MPGILPMKVIKVGSSSQSRIAQACDRCRSKKIRCDGIRPCCTQCANVGFECKTSDKLSRRAFPRGYTESLEDRVRSLEAEVRELKNLLDEKDEKIDVLSRIHSFTSPAAKNRATSSKSPSSSSSTAATNAPSSASVSSDGSKSNSREAEAVVRIQPVPSLSKTIRPETPFSGTSSTRAFASIVTSSMQEMGKSTPSMHTLTSLPTMVHHPNDRSLKKPSRLVSDQLINIFFQEWAPLYPVVHRPTILKAYDHYISDSPSLRANKHVIAQLNLIFSIAAGSSKSRTDQDPVLFERNWYPILESLAGEPSIAAVQCYVLAQMYCMLKGDYRSLLRYRGLSISLCQMLGLHHSQARLASNPLKAETRKKVFWCQYVLDRFASALTGLPAMLREQDISTELPEDVDDENVTETGFLPTLPGESTRLSSALALFGASRVLHKVVGQLYSSTNGEIAISRIRSLADELDAWLKALPAHLRLEFANDKPSTNVTSSRSPLLSLIYYYIRTLIHRPAASYGPPNIASPSVLALADSCKHIIQILQLLDERRMSLSACINRVEVIFISGLGLLWQNMSLNRDSKLVKENQKLLAAVIEQLECESSASAAEFSTLANLLTSNDRVNREISPQTAARSSPPQSVPKINSALKQLLSFKSRESTSTPSTAARTESNPRRATFSTTQPPVVPNKLAYPSAPTKLSRNIASSTEKRRSIEPAAEYNLDYYPLGADPRAMSCSDLSRTAVSNADWEYILRDLDRGQANIYNGIYGGKEPGDQEPFAALSENFPHTYHPNTSAFTLPSQVNDIPNLSPEAWSSSSREFSTEHSQAPQSVLSTEESFGSTEELLVSNDFGMSLADSHKGIVIPNAEENFHDLGLLELWDQQLPV